MGDSRESKILVNLRLLAKQFGKNKIRRQWRWGGWAV
jgi:hypothetical protein